VRPCRSGSSWARTASSCAKAFTSSWPSTRTSRSSPRWATQRRCANFATRSARTSCSRTSAWPPTNTDEGIRFASELREQHPDIGVVILSQYADPTYALALLEDGSDGRAYLLKERVHNRAELMAAIRAVAEGGSMIDPKIVESLVTARSRAARSPLNQLTAREREVLAEIANGKSNTAIAADLYLTKRAVEKHINSIFLKLGLAYAEDVSKRVKATLMFLAEETPPVPH
jgi:DNA-binding NarL/FixJ family response regulator